MFADPGAGQVLVPSPLLRETPARILLHFQLAPGGGLSSPQVPAGVLGARAVTERHTTTALLSEHRSRLSELRGRRRVRASCRDTVANRRSSGRAFSRTLCGCCRNRRARDTAVATRVPLAQLLRQPHTYGEGGVHDDSSSNRVFSRGRGEG